MSVTRTTAEITIGAEGTLTVHSEDRAQTLRELATAIPTIVRWGHELSERLESDHRLIVAGLGGDDGCEDAFAAQVAQARHGDVLLLLSSGGCSADLIRAVRIARARGAVTWAFTRAMPDLLARECDSVIALHGTASAVQEAQRVGIRMLCRVVDAHTRSRRERAQTPRHGAAAS